MLPWAEFLVSQKLYHAHLQNRCRYSLHLPANVLSAKQVKYVKHLVNFPSATGVRSHVIAHLNRGFPHLHEVFLSTWEVAITSAPASLGFCQEMSAEVNTVCSTDEHTEVLTLCQADGGALIDVCFHPSHPCLPKATQRC